MVKCGPKWGPNPTGLVSLEEDEETSGNTRRRSEKAPPARREASGDIKPANTLILKLLAQKLRN